MKNIYIYRQNNFLKKYIILSLRIEVVDMYKQLFYFILYSKNLDVLIEVKFRLIIKTYCLNNHHHNHDFLGLGYYLWLKKPEALGKLPASPKPHLMPEPILISAGAYDGLWHNNFLLFFAVIIKKLLLIV